VRPILAPVIRRRPSSAPQPEASEAQASASVINAGSDPRQAGGAAHPVRLPCGLVLGGGTVYPEFRIALEPDSPGDAAGCVGQTESLLSAASGSAAGAVFDLDLAATRPSGGWEAIVRGVRLSLERAKNETGFAAALRVTLSASDARIREAIESGAEIVNLETTAGLKLFRRALRASDVAGLILAAGVVSALAVSRAWSRAEAQFEGSVAARGGDSARPFIREIIRCLREKQAPEVICAVAAAVCAVRTLASLEAGATGPLPQGCWESLILKAIRGCPVSLSDAWPWEAQAAGMADLWSSGAGVAQTLAECALLSSGKAAMLRGAGSGSCGPLARILSEVSVLAIAEAIQTCQQPYQRAIAAAYAAANLLSENGPETDTTVSAGDRASAARIAEDLLSLPQSGQALLESLGQKYGSTTITGEMQP
jgi:hypothetical protein